MKFFLNISKEDQLARFAEWLEDPKRNWKISESDYTERALWDDYIAAFEDAISATSTREAPWYIIPANHKWFRNLAVSQIMADTMEALDMAFPKPSVDLAEIQRKYHAAVAAGASENDGSRRPATGGPNQCSDRASPLSARSVAKYTGTTMWRTGHAAGARRSNIAIRRSFSPHYEAGRIHPPDRQQQPVRPRDL